jgi:hypothetical protein
MKKVLFVVAVVALSASFAQAQHNLISFSIGGNAGTKVQVVNNTTDNTYIHLIVDETPIRGVLGKGKTWSQSFPLGYNADVVLLIQICSSAAIVTFPNQPPTWASDRSILGDLTITPEYMLQLKQSPSADDLNRRVKDIQNFLHGQLGGKEKIAEIKAWHRSVKAYGIYATDAFCADPQTIGSKIQVPANNYYARTALITVEGNHQKGYRANGNNGYYW